VERITNGTGKRGKHRKEKRGRGVGMKQGEYRVKKSERREDSGNRKYPVP
jgi:hypothetical protein